MFMRNYKKTMFITILLFVIIFLGCSSPLDPKIRVREKFNDGWTFINEDVKDAQAVDFDDSGWRKLNLPHDWAIEGPFSKEVYFQGGYLPYPGVGWYRKTFPFTSEGKRALLEFDGVMMNPQVWVNGEFVGEWAFGYSSFAFDITDYLKPNEDNVIAVRVENLEYSSRWYPGSGIYRNVWLTLTDPVHVAHWGTYVTTPEISDSLAVVKVETKVENQASDDHVIELETPL